MARHVLHRLLLTLPALWLVLTLVFLLIHIVPGDPVEQMLGEGAAPGQIAQLRHTLGLDEPLLTQYGKYLWQIARGDLGQSFKFQAPVRRVIFERYPALKAFLHFFNIVFEAPDGRYRAFVNYHVVPDYPRLAVPDNLSFEHNAAGH